MTDIVNNPDHYTSSNIECIDYLKDNMYLHRFRHKGKPLEDLKKARWYLDYLISELEGPM